MRSGPFGAFGKIPSVGDFFRINAPPGFASVWDEWLQRCLVSGAHAYGPDWDELYMSVPIWRFCLSPGVAGPSGIMGVLMPSVDRVGRRFPLTLMGPLSGSVPALEMHFRQAEIFEELETISLSVLDEDISKETLEDRLSDIGLATAQGGSICQITAGSSVVCSGGDTDQIASSLVTALLAKSFNTPTIWSTKMDEDTRLMVCNGLPVGSNMQGLFDLTADLWKESIS
jgi:type VI secretion system protein ImpM